jgi:hypothetical protein
MKSTIVIVSAILALSACGGGKKVSFDTLETARNQARENAIWNAQHFRSTDPRFAGSDIVARGDSTQDFNCPQGDGWASMTFIFKDTNASINAKCSTVSTAVGCMTDADFKQKRYAQEDGHCNEDLPFPFKKLVQ